VFAKQFSRQRPEISTLGKIIRPERPQASCVEPTTVALLDQIIARANSRGRKSVKKMRLAVNFSNDVLLTWHPRPCPSAHKVRASIRPPSPCSLTRSHEPISARPKIGEKHAISSISFQRRIADMASKALPKRRNFDTEINYSGRHKLSRPTRCSGRHKLSRPTRCSS
jgi:hypothetical protein